MPTDTFNTKTGQWEPAKALPEPRLWRLWRFLRLMPSSGPKEGDRDD